MSNRTVIVKQRHDYDCGIASLSMLLNTPYGDIAALVILLNPDPKDRRNGMNMKDLEAVIEECGFKTKRVYRKEGYLDHATGILGLLGTQMGPGGHWVYIKDGMILDPDGGEAWEADDYVKELKARPATLLTII